METSELKHGARRLAWIGRRPPEPEIPGSSPGGPAVPFKYPDKFYRVAFQGSRLPKGKCELLGDLLGEIMPADHWCTRININALSDEARRLIIERIKRKLSGSRKLLKHWALRGAPCTTTCTGMKGSLMK